MHAIIKIQFSTTHIRTLFLPNVLNIIFIPHSSIVEKNGWVPGKGKLFEKRSNCYQCCLRLVFTNLLTRRIMEYLRPHHHCHNTCSSLKIWREECNNAKKLLSFFQLFNAIRIFSHSCSPKWCYIGGCLPKSVTKKISRHQRIFSGECG